MSEIEIKNYEQIQALAVRIQKSTKFPLNRKLALVKTLLAHKTLASEKDQVMCLLVNEVNERGSYQTHGTILIPYFRIFPVSVTPPIAKFNCTPRHPDSDPPTVLEYSLVLSINKKLSEVNLTGEYWWNDNKIVWFDPFEPLISVQNDSSAYLCGSLDYVKWCLDFSKGVVKDAPKQW